MSALIEEVCQPWVVLLVVAIIWRVVLMLPDAIDRQDLGAGDAPSKVLPFRRREGP